MPTPPPSDTSCTSWAPESCLFNLRGILFFSYGQTGCGLSQRGPELRTSTNCTVSGSKRLVVLSSQPHVTWMFTFSLSHSSCWKKQLCFIEMLHSYEINLLLNNKQQSSRVVFRNPEKRRIFCVGTLQQSFQVWTIRCLQFCLNVSNFFCTKIDSRQLGSIDDRNLKQKWRYTTHLTKPAYMWRWALSLQFRISIKSKIIPSVSRSIAWYELSCQVRIQKWREQKKSYNLATSALDHGCAAKLRSRLFWNSFVKAARRHCNEKRP